LIFDFSVLRFGIYDLFHFICCYLFLNFGVWCDFGKGIRETCRSGGLEFVGEGAYAGFDVVVAGLELAHAGHHPIEFVVVLRCEALLETGLDLQLLPIATLG
jgi:hypothetical protein